jgi:uncharacterized protein YebE (UPF0316 family)
MEFILTQETMLVALGIFIARLANQSIDTIRFMMMLRGRKGIAWVLGVAETVIFVITLSAVFSNLQNILYIAAYPTGFATGNTLGMVIEERMAIGHVNIRIISSKRGSAIAEKLRAEGFAVTEIPARGRDGMVTLMDVSVRRKQVKRARQIAEKIDESAFITGEELRPMVRGFWGGMK